MDKHRGSTLWSAVAERSDDTALGVVLGAAQGPAPFGSDLPIPKRRGAGASRRTPKGVARDGWVAFMVHTEFIILRFWSAADTPFYGTRLEG